MNGQLKTEMVIVAVSMIFGAGCAQTPTVVTDEARWKNAIDLLSRINPAEDVKGGKWEIKDGALTSRSRISRLKSMIAAFPSPRPSRKGNQTVSMCGFQDAGAPSHGV